MSRPSEQIPITLEKAKELCAKLVLKHNGRDFQKLLDVNEIEEIVNHLNFSVAHTISGDISREYQKFTDGKVKVKTSKCLCKFLESINESNGEDLTVSRTSLKMFLYYLGIPYSQRSKYTEITKPTILLPAPQENVRHLVEPISHIPEIEFEEKTVKEKVKKPLFSRGEDGTLILIVEEKAVEEKAKGHIHTNEDGALCLVKVENEIAYYIIRGIFNVIFFILAYNYFPHIKKAFIDPTNLSFNDCLVISLLLIYATWALFIQDNPKENKNYTQASGKNNEPLYLLRIGEQGFIGSLTLIAIFAFSVLVYYYFPLFKNLFKNPSSLTFENWSIIILIAIIFVAAIISGQSSKKRERLEWVSEQ